MNWEPKILLEGKTNSGRELLGFYYSLTIDYSNRPIRGRIGYLDILLFENIIYPTFVVVTECTRKNYLKFKEPHQII